MKSDEQGLNAKLGFARCSGVVSGSSGVQIEGKAVENE